MVSIFYDLETTHLTPMGQILNCCFVAVDRSWNEVARYSENIKISPLQLPDPDAIMANRTRVLEHQASATKTERQVLKEIHAFIGDMIGRSGGAVELIGYNSARFDLNFLRTSLIRNGLNPYFYGKVTPRDLLHTVRYLSVIDKTFPRAPRPGVGDERQNKLSLGLETISHALGLLTEKQSHHSVADVKLTIRLAKTLAKTHGIDARAHVAYPAAELHRLGRERSAVVALLPQVELHAPETAIRAPYALLSHDAKNGLWIDLAQYRDGKGRDAIRWMGANSGALFADVDSNVELEYRADSAREREEFRDLDINNFFPRSTCDIEADIFRLSFNDIDNLTSAIWGGRTGAVAASGPSDARELYIRHRLSEIDWTDATETQEKRLAIYSNYRYGGSCNIRKGHLEPLDPTVTNPAAHPTLADYMARLNELEAGTTNSSDEPILRELRSFYEDSPIMRVTGRQLLEHVRVPPLSVVTSPDELSPAPNRSLGLQP
jgi:hypothetical protein